MSTINALSASHADITAAMALAVTGDTVLVPAETATWTSKLIVDKAITLQGAGIGLTIIRDNVQSGSFLSIRPKANEHTRVTRVTGFEFQNGGRTNYAQEGENGGGCIDFIGQDNRTDSQLRWDNCKWDGLNGVCAMSGAFTGVFDHLTIDRGGKIGAWLHPFQQKWNGGLYADRSMSDPIEWGNGNWLFIEDCEFGYTASGVTDARLGSRIVFRHNIVNTMHLDSHGTESGSFGGNRGTVAMDVYENSFRSGSGLIAFVRSGVIVIHDNTYTNWSGPTIGLRCYRMRWGFGPWGDADGANGWDANSLSNPFYSALVVQSATANQTSLTGTVTVNDAPFVGNLIGYTVVKTDGTFTGGQERYGIITSNTTNTLNYASGLLANSCLAFSAGEQLKVVKINHCLDQPGRAGGIAITRANIGSPQLPPDTGDGDRVNQITVPCYQWNNGISSFSPSTDKGIEFGIHYFNVVKPDYTTYTYPHPLVTGTPPPVGRVISVAGSLAFGDHYVNSTSQQTFSITNIGDMTLTVTSITYPPSGVFTGSFSGTIAPGVTQSVTVTFAPTGVTSYGGLVTVNCDATNTGANTLPISGTGTARPLGRIIQITGPTTFGNVIIGGSGRQLPFIIRNVGDQVLTVTSITYPPSGVFAGAYTGTISPGAAHFVFVTFNPTDVIDYTGTMVVNSDADSGDGTHQLSGTGKEQGGGGSGGSGSNKARPTAIIRR